VSEASEFMDVLEVGFDVGCIGEYQLQNSRLHIGTGYNTQKIKLLATLYDAGSYNHKSINHYVGIGFSYLATDCNCMPNL
jgi:hypothetical protein